MGRWSNRDPIGETGGVNLYEFIFNNCINNADNKGHIVVKRREKTRDVASFPEAWMRAEAKVSRTVYYGVESCANGVEYLGKKKEPQWPMPLHNGFL